MSVIPLPPRQELFLERPLPSSEESERAILGGILLDNALMASAIERLEPADFYGPLHRRIFRAMIDLFNASKKIDPILIGEELKKTCDIESIGGVTTITNLTYGLPHFTDISEYLKVVKDKSTIRSLVRACGEIRSEALEEEYDAVDEILDKAEAAMYSLRSDNVVGTTTRMHTEIRGTLQAAKQRAAAGSAIIGVGTGFAAMDKQLQGFRAGQQIIVAARPSMGKTALVTRMCYQIPVKSGIPTLLISLEMAKEEVADRIICAECSIDNYVLRTGLLNEQQWNDADEVTMNLEGAAPLFINDDPYFTVPRIRAEMRRINAELRKQGTELGLVIIDHIGLIENDQTYRGDGNRNNELSKISRALKKLAREFKIPIVTLSQLSRQPENRADHRPQLGDLRESGAIEQDADVVLFIYRDDYYQKDPNLYTNVAEIIVAKNRNGPTGPFNLHFEKKYARFADLAQGQSFRQPQEGVQDIIL